MTKHRDLDYGDRLPESLLDALEEYVSTLVSPNFTLTLASATTLQVVAGEGNGQVGVGIDGRWRWITATANAVHPGGAAGAWDVYVTASDNAFTPGSPETDSTDYGFDLEIRQGGSPPTAPLYRKVATCTWTGSAITAIQPLVSILPPAGSLTATMIADASVALAHLAAGVGSASSGEALPSTGLYTGYRFTLVGDDDLARDFVYRPDIDAVYPWFLVGGPPHRFVGSSYPSGDAASAFLTSDFPVTGGTSHWVSGWELAGLPVGRYLVQAEASLHAATGGWAALNSESSLRKYPAGDPVLVTTAEWFVSGGDEEIKLKFANADVYVYGQSVIALPTRLAT